MKSPCRKFPGLPGKASGFSLVEAVVVIVVMSILSIGIVRFITSTSQGYVSTANRNQLSSTGRTVIDRISFELHNALPNSIRTTTVAGNGNECLEFVPVIAATTYVDAPFGSPGTTFDVVEFYPDQSGATATGSVYAVIYPNDTGQIYDTSLPGTRGPRQEVSSIMPVSTFVDEITLTGSHRFRRRSAVQRLFLTRDPVSFCVVGARLYRYANYGFSTAQLEPGDIGFPASTPNRTLLADSIDNTGLIAFDFLSATRRRNAVIQIQLNFSDNGDEVTLNHEVLLQSTP